MRIVRQQGPELGLVRNLKGAAGVHYSSGGYITLGKFTASAVEKYVSEREN